MINKPFIIGADECGTGSLIFSLVVCGVKAEKDWTMEGLGDSKKLKAQSEKKLYLVRDELLKRAEQGEIEFSVVERSHHLIDQDGLSPSLKSAYVEVFQSLWSEDCLVINDGTINFKGMGIDKMEIVSMIKADTKIPTVMAASILGKCFRDEKVKEIAKECPDFGWEKNMGYSSKDHLKAIENFGPSKFHRMSFAPMKNLVKK